MKNNIKITVTVIIALVLFLIITGISYASVKEADTSKSIQEYPKNSVKTLISGIQSDNTGLKKSSVYLAGVYEIPETVGPLVEELSKEQNTGIRNLIALSLLKIGDEKGLKAIVNLLAGYDETNIGNKINFIKRHSAYNTD